MDQQDVCSTVKASPSQTDFTARFLRDVLGKLGYLTDGLTLDQLSEVHFEHHRRFNVQQKRQELRRQGIDADAMNDDQVIQASAAEEARQEHRRRVADLFERSECPPRHVLRLSELDDNPRWMAAREKLLNGIENNHIIALLGIRGPGKTQLAVSAIWELSNRLKTSRYLKALDLFREIRSTYNASAGGPSEKSVIRLLCRLDLLVIDELDQRAETTFEQNALVNLIDRRYDAKRPTLLISNQPSDGFAQMMGDSVVSRMCEHNSGTVIICDWPSYRTGGAGGGR